MMKIGAIVLALLLGGGATWYFLSEPPKRGLPPVMEALCTRVAADFGEKLPRLQNVENLLIVPRVGTRDEDQQLKGIVMDAVQRAGKYSLREWEAMKDQLDDGNVWEMVLSKSGLLPTQPPQTLDQASSAASFLKRANIQIDGVLFVDCRLMQGKNDDAFGASVEIEGEFFDLNTNKKYEPKVVARESIDSRLNLLYLQYKMQKMSFLARLFLWMIVVCGQPWALIAVCRMVLRKRENTWNAVLLAIFTVVGVFTAWPLIFAFADIGLGSMLFFLILTGLCGYYNYDAIDYIERRLL